MPVSVEANQARENAVRWLYPRLPREQLPAMLRIAGCGTLLAGLYGVVHDQLSFAISPEYFTKMKFRQFAWANLGLPARWFASEVGFLATWWVGAIAGWVLARVGLASIPKHEQRAQMWRAFACVAFAAPLGGLIGWGIGAFRTGGDLSDWADWQKTLDIADLPAFVTVAHLHAGGYIGAVSGLVLAVLVVRRYVAEHRK